MKNLLSLNLDGINRASGRNTNQMPMEEVINIGRRNAGIHQAIGKKPVKALYHVNLELFELYNFPALSDYTTLIGSLQETGEVYKLTPSSTQVILTIDEPGTEEFRTISFLGNIMTVHTNIKRYNVKYDPDEDTYTILHELPTPKFLIGSSTSRTYGPYTLDAKDTFDEAVADYIEKDAQVRRAGGIEGHASFIAAWKLYDGSYIKHSPIVEAWFGGDGVVCDTSATFQFDNLIYHGASGRAYTDSDFRGILAEWGGIVLGLAIFMTIPESLYNIDVAQELYGVSGTDLIPPKNEVGMRHMDADKIGYYKVHEIPIETLAQTLDTTPSDIISFKMEVGNLDVLATKEDLPVDPSSHHDISANTSFLYNARCHFGKIHNRLYLGHFPLFLANDTGSLIPSRYEYSGYTLQGVGSRDWQLTSVVKLHTIEGDRFVYQTWGIGDVEVWEKAANPDLLFLTQILSYPDIRAYKMDVYLTKVSTGVHYLAGSYELTPNEFHNFASYINYDETADDILPIEIDLTAPGDVVTNNDFIAATEGVLNREYDDLNRIQVSAQNNPFVFPPSNSYRVGVRSKSIVAMSAMGEAISQGQFGQFPVYVFTESGIYAMQVGSGEVVYSTINPLNSDVLSNVYSVLNVGKGVVYATSKGLFLISGTQRVEISNQVEGKLDNPIYDKSDYQGFLNTDVFIELLTFISQRTFNETLQNGRIGFDRKNNEIIISYYDLDPTLSSASGSASGSGSDSRDDATKDGYSYVYNLDSGQWTKFSQQFNQFIDSYPDFLAIVGNSLYNLTEESTQDRHIVLQSRPVTLGNHAFKKIVRCNIYGHFVPTIDTFPSFYIYGSQDGVKWHLIQGQQVTYAQTHSTITIQRTVGWCKYYIFLFIGQLGLDSNVEGIQVEFDTRYTGKLR